MDGGKLLATLIKGPGGGVGVDTDTKYSISSNTEVSFKNIDTCKKYLKAVLVPETNIFSSCMCCCTELEG